MPPNNTASRKSNELVEISLSLDERRFPTKCHSKEETRCGGIHINGITQSKSQTNVKENTRTASPQRKRSVTSLVDELLCDIYSKMEVKRRTSATTCDLSWQDSDNSRYSHRESRSILYWASKDICFLRFEKSRLEKLITEEGNNLVKHLKRKNFLLVKREAHYDVITAYIQAISTKRREDTKMKFSLSPGAETGFSQWVDAMKMVAQLPGGMPPEFRTKLWLQLSEKHLHDQNVDWEKAEAIIFNEWANPDDEELGVQIVKDLHRTGCSLFCGEQEHNQALLKRVLLAYARWNKNVGYCQGFNMLAALILQVMDKDEKNAVKVMIYLIEGVLPESYFANNLRGLSVDMAVFRDLLRLRLPKLSKHLEALQHDTNAGTSYEPPLTNVFTMQWFLTLFSNCLPQQTVLRVWDLVFLYGNEVLLRTALAIWGILQDRVITVESADEFYSIMGVVTREMLEFGLMDANTLVKTIAMVDPFPNELQELREKYLYNISPWTQSVQSAAKKGIRLFYSDPDDQDDTEDEDKIALATAYGVFRRRESTSRELQVSGPTLDISVLKQQYAKLRQRQRQAHVIITAACSSSLPGSLGSGPSVSVNHLLMGKSALVNKGRRIGPPEGSIPPPNNKRGDQDGRRPKVVISGETFHWKDAEKGKLPNESNKKGKEAEGMKTNHDRMEVSQASVEESLRKKDAGGSSSSSTSTELCDEDFHLDSDDASDSSCHPPRLPGRTPESPLVLSAHPARVQTPDNGGCEEDNLREIKDLAIGLVRDIEERIQTSNKLTRRKNSGIGGQEEEEEEEEKKVVEGAVAAPKIDNTSNVISPLDTDIQFLHDNILKPEPEVPISQNVIVGGREEGKREEGRRRKSDLGLSVIRENLEMLSKFSQKSSEKTVGDELEGRNEVIPQPVEKEVQKSPKSPKTEAQEPFRPAQGLLVEKAISPMVERTPGTLKVNKEVNTEITFGVEEVEISTSRPKLQPEEPQARNSRETFFRESEIKDRIETSKSDWELKMRKIAELETTTRETLNEIQARSHHRKSLHRSLDRTTRRSYFDDDFRLEGGSPDRSFVPKIELDSSEESNQRRLKISARSFDAITSRTEKLLGSSDFSRSADEAAAPRRSLSPEFEPSRRPRDSTSKFKKLIEESYGEEGGSFEPYSSTGRYSDYLTPRTYEDDSGDVVRVVQNGGKTSVDLLTRKFSPERWKPELEDSKSSFNPFPKRSPSRPKELGVKLGLYPTSPEAPSRKS